MHLKSMYRLRCCYKPFYVFEIHFYKCKVIKWISQMFFFRKCYDYYHVPLLRIIQKIKRINGEKLDDVIIF